MCVIRVLEERTERMEQKEFVKKYSYKLFRFGKRHKLTFKKLRKLQAG